MSGQMVVSFDTSATGALHDIQLDYYGQRAAAASAEGMVVVFDLSEGQQKMIGQLKGGHAGPVWKVSWAHPKFGSVIASCGYDMKVIIWKEVQPGNWQIAHMDSSHAASVNDVEFCPWEYGLRLACASSDGTVSVLTYQQDGSWHRATFNSNTGGSQSLSWAPVQKRDGQPTGIMRLVVGGCDNSAVAFKFENEAWSQEFPPLPAGHTDWVRDVAWCPCESASVIASGSWDKTVIIYSQEMEGQQWRQVSRLTLPSKVQSLSWCESGSILGVSCGEDETHLYKETYDGSFEEVGKVNEPGYVEVPNSITAAIASGANVQHEQDKDQAAMQQSAELQQQTANVLDSFGIS